MKPSVNPTWSSGAGKALPAALNWGEGSGLYTLFCSVIGCGLHVEGGVILGETIFLSHGNAQRGLIGECHLLVTLQQLRRGIWGREGAGTTGSTVYRPPILQMI